MATFVGGFVNNEFVINTSNVPNVDDMNATIETRFAKYPSLFARLLEECCDDEQNDRRQADLEVQSTNASH